MSIVFCHEARPFLHVSMHFYPACTAVSMWFVSVFGTSSATRWLPPAHLISPKPPHLADTPRHACRAMKTRLLTKCHAVLRVEVWDGTVVEDSKGVKTKPTTRPDSSQPIQPRREPASRPTSAQPWRSHAGLQARCKRHSRTRGRRPGESPPRPRTASS